MTTTAPELTCRQDGCPFPEKQTCLEGFIDFESCPNTEDLGEDNEAETGTHGASEADLNGPDADDDDEVVVPKSPPMLELGGAVAFSVEDLEHFLARETGSVVLVAGPVGSGKTTLIVELYARFLYGPFANAKFSGSETLRALDSRHFPALEKSGAAVPTTNRTPDEDLRLLHLRLSVGGRDRHLLFTDVRGEFFENIVDGEAVSREIPIIRRVDRCLIVIDGERAANPIKRDSVFTEARQLAGGLRSESGLDIDTPVAVLCTKWDLVVTSGREESVRREADKIAAFAAKDSHDPAVLTLSVRPGPPASDIAGLAEVVEWVTASSTRSEPVDGAPIYTPPSDGRHFLKEPGTA